MCAWACCDDAQILVSEETAFRENCFPRKSETTPRLNVRVPPHGAFGEGCRARRGESAHIHMGARRESAKRRTVFRCLGVGVAVLCVIILGTQARERSFARTQTERETREWTERWVPRTDLEVSKHPSSIMSILEGPVGARAVTTSHRARRSSEGRAAPPPPQKYPT